MNNVISFEYKKETERLAKQYPSYFSGRTGLKHNLNDLQEFKLKLEDVLADLTSKKSTTMFNLSKTDDALVDINHYFDSFKINQSKTYVAEQLKQIQFMYGINNYEFWLSELTNGRIETDNVEQELAKVEKLSMNNEYIQYRDGYFQPVGIDYLVSMLKTFIAIIQINGIRIEKEYNEYNQGKPSIL